MQFYSKFAKLRSDNNLSQQQLADILGVSRQAISRWETGEALPTLDNVIMLAKHFNISLDSFLCERDMRIIEESQKDIKPEYSALHKWEKYSHGLMTEYRQCTEEGLDVQPYLALFEAVSKMPESEAREKAADIIFDIVRSAPTVAEYKYTEPSDYDGITALCKNDIHKVEITDKNTIRKKIEGAWYGRIAGCLLGKPIEGIRRHELIPFLKETGNYPMHRYIESNEAEAVADKYTYKLKGKCYADRIDSAPVDDDTNYTVLYQYIIEKYTKDFLPEDVAKAWLDMQPKREYCTAERVAYINFVNGYLPPYSAQYKNHYREWIGAQIRADYFGFICPGDPRSAARLAWRDASVSHIKNGIYGEMFVAAMLAYAAVCDDIMTVIRAGISQIPTSSRLYEKVDGMLCDFENGADETAAFAKIFDTYKDTDSHDWCHTISNAMIVVGALLYGGGDYSASICKAVQAGFDTDCNGATVGSIVGMMKGIDAIEKRWITPINGRLKTGIFGYGTVNIDDLVEKTLSHI